MNARPLFPTLAPLGILILGGALLASRPASAQVPAGGNLEQVEWALLSDDCASPPVGASRLSCGQYGDFYLGQNLQSSCPPKAAGRELPKIYAMPSLERDVIIPANPLGRQRPALALEPMTQAGASQKSAGQDTPIPCRSGSCFSTPSPDASWVAVIDWDNWHGWTTGWTTTWLSGLPVQLYDLGGSDLRELFGPAVSDAHFLARLCEIADGVEEQVFQPPKVLNMSFGRLFQDDAGDGNSCAAHELSCQVGRVIDHLVELGVVPVAAAGNHGHPMFPASYDNVLSTGSLDLARFRTHLQITGSWESPSGPNFYLPGYGLCLGYRGSDGSEWRWPAPPGSSYSSAMLAGWMAGVLDRHPLERPLDIDWTIAWSPDDACFMLSDQVPQSCNQQINRIFEEILLHEPSCWSAGIREPSLFVSTDRPAGRSFTKATDGGGDSILDGLPSFVEWARTSHRPDPSADPCVPCATGGLDQSFTGSDGALKSGPGVDRDLVLDLSASSPLRPAFTYEALYLRSGEDFFPLLDADQPEDWPALRQLGAGGVASLVIQNAGAVLEAELQPSLVFVVCLQPGNCFWNSIPVLH
ncbi:MAG: S8/S53 family peptidase [Acidobacteriota bacterium]